MTMGFEDIRTAVGSVNLPDADLDLLASIPALSWERIHLEFEDDDLRGQRFPSTPDVYSRLEMVVGFLNEEQIDAIKRFVAANVLSASRRETPSVDLRRFLEAVDQLHIIALQRPIHCDSNLAKMKLDNSHISNNDLVANAGATHNERVSSWRRRPSMLSVGSGSYVPSGTSRSKTPSIRGIEVDFKSESDSLGSRGDARPLFANSDLFSTGEGRVGEHSLSTRKHSAGGAKKPEWVSLPLVPRPKKGEFRRGALTAPIDRDLQKDALMNDSRRETTQRSRLVHLGDKKLAEVEGLLRRSAVDVRRAMAALSIASEHYEAAKSFHGKHLDRWNSLYDRIRFLVSNTGDAVMLSAAEAMDRGFHDAALAHCAEAVRWFEASGDYDAIDALEMFQESVYDAQCVASVKLYTTDYANTMRAAAPKTFVPEEEIDRAYDGLENLRTNEVHVLSCGPGSHVFAVDGHCEVEASLVPVEAETWTNVVPARTCASMAAPSSTNSTHSEVPFSSLAIWDSIPRPQRTCAAQAYTCRCHSMPLVKNSDEKRKRFTIVTIVLAPDDPTDVAGYGPFALEIRKTPVVVSQGEDGQAVNTEISTCDAAVDVETRRVFMLPPPEYRGAGAFEALDVMEDCFLETSSIVLIDSNAMRYRFTPGASIDVPGGTYTLCVGCGPHYTSRFRPVVYPMSPSPFNGDWGTARKREYVNPRIDQRQRMRVILYSRPVSQSSLTAATAASASISSSSPAPPDQDTTDPLASPLNHAADSDSVVDKAGSNSGNGGIPTDSGGANANGRADATASTCVGPMSLQLHCSAVRLPDPFIAPPGPGSTCAVSPFHGQTNAFNPSPVPQPAGLGLYPPHADSHATRNLSPMSPMSPMSPTPMSPHGKVLTWDVGDADNARAFVRAMSASNSCRSLRNVANQGCMEGCDSASAVESAAMHNLDVRYGSAPEWPCVLTIDLQPGMLYHVFVTPRDRHVASTTTRVQTDPATDSPAANPCRSVTSVSDVAYLVEIYGPGGLAAVFSPPCQNHVTPPLGTSSERASPVCSSISDWWSVFTVDGAYWGKLAGEGDLPGDETDERVGTPATALIAQSPTRSRSRVAPSTAQSSRGRSRSPSPERSLSPCRDFSVATPESMSRPRNVSQQSVRSDTPASRRQRHGSLGIGGVAAGMQSALTPVSEIVPGPAPLPVGMVPPPPSRTGLGKQRRSLLATA
eukprot:Rmarinus@m.27177